MHSALNRFKKSPKFLCPPPPKRKVNSLVEESVVACGIDKVRGALGNEYIKALHYCIAHLRRADGALRPKSETRPVGSMNLLAAGDTVRLVTWSMLRKTDFGLHILIVTAPMHRYNPRKSDPLYGYWFFEAYYEAFATELSKLNPKFVPTTAAGVEELLSFQANM